MTLPGGSQNLPIILCGIGLGLTSFIGGLVTEPRLSSAAYQKIANATQNGKGTTAKSGRPLPRFVSLKSDRVNLRGGPGRDYPIQWVFRRAGLPVEVINEFEGWREVRDSEGTKGWVSQGLLSRRRTALVSPWDEKKAGSANAASDRIVRYSDSSSAQPIAQLEPGVIANLHSCDGTWCQVSIGDYGGYLQQKVLWGVYPGERFN